MTDIKRVIALGFFDGVHIGHSALLEKALCVANKSGLVPAVISFDGSPKAVVTGKHIELINSGEDRIGLIQRIFGINDITLMHFDHELSIMPWQIFADKLISDFGAEHLVAGHDYKFGFGGEGNAAKLNDFCVSRGIGCDIISPVTYKGKVVSSTIIRKLLTSGEIRLAGEYLGHMHVLTDIVRHGDRLGRTLGVPTINMAFGPNVLVPAHGVYAAQVHLENGSALHGVTNIGTRPTVSDNAAITAETHILDFNEEIYGERVRIEFCEMLRSEMKFRNVDELKSQIKRDAESARVFFEYYT